MKYQKLNQVFGFTLIELMIVVAIVAILSAVSIPAYQSYIRRSYVSEATSSIAAIKSAEESYFTVNGCYVEADAHPSTIPAGSSVAWGSSPATGWGNNALGVRPDKNVRFQYQVYASNSINCAAPVNNEAAVDAALATVTAGGTNTACISDVVGAADSFVSSSFFPDDWYVVVVRGDLNGNGDNSLIISAIDDSAVITCNELE